MLVNGKPGDSISIRDRGLLYGDGVFRTLRVTNGQAEFWSLHYQKLFHDCNAVDIICPAFEVLSSELAHLSSEHSECAVKLVVTRGVAARGYAASAYATPTHFWDVLPLPSYPAVWTTQGIKARLCELRLSKQPRLAGIKHLNRLENVLAASEWNDAEIAEGLLMDAEGNVIEGVRSNLFVVKNGTLSTPSLLACGVAGVQRDRVIEWANSANVPLEIRAMHWDEVCNADELFITNSLIDVWPIRELGQKFWASFPMTQRVQQGLGT